MDNTSDQNLSSPTGSAKPAEASERMPISRRPILDYFNTSAVRGRVWRLLSSREKLREGMKTLAWVVPLTFLIWIYAEREQIDAPNLPNASNVMLDIVTSDQSRIVESAPSSLAATYPTVNLQLTGPKQAVEHVKELLMMRIPREKLRIDIGNSMGIGRDQYVNVVERIQNLEFFKSNGVTVQDSQPPTIKINIFRRFTRDVAIQIPSSITNLSPETRFEPAKITLSGPDDPSLNIADLKAFAKLEGIDVLNQTGPHTLSSVAVQLSNPDPRLTITPAKVTASVVVVASDVNYEITDSIPIYIAQTAATLNSYSLTLTNGASIANIHVTGPQKGIDAIKDKSFACQATLHVEPTDAGKTISRELEYKLPDGVKVAPVDEHRTVEFTLSRRE